MEALYTVILTDDTGEHVTDMAWINHSNLDSKGAINYDMPETTFDSREEALQIIAECQLYANKHHWTWAHFILDEI